MTGFLTQRRVAMQTLGRLLARMAAETEAELEMGGETVPVELPDRN